MLYAIEHTKDMNYQWKRRGRLANAEATAKYDGIFWAQECSDPTCWHARSAHAPECEDTCETLEGEEFPCGCMGFRESGWGSS